MTGLYIVHPALRKGPLLYKTLPPISFPAYGPGESLWWGGFLKKVGVLSRGWKSGEVMAGEGGEWMVEDEVTGAGGGGELEVGRLLRG